MCQINRPLPNGQNLNLAIDQRTKQQIKTLLLFEELGEGEVKEEILHAGGGGVRRLGSLGEQGANGGRV